MEVLQLLMAYLEQNGLSFAINAGIVRLLLVVTVIMLLCYAIAYIISYVRCTMLIKRLKRDHLDEKCAIVYGLRYRYLAEARDGILEEYRNEASGPAKQRVLKKCMSEIDRKLREAQRKIADEVKQAAWRRYERLGEGLAQDPVSDEKLDRLLQCTLTECLNDFKQRCEGVDDVLREAHEANLKRIHDEKSHEIAKVNKTEREQRSYRSLANYVDAVEALGIILTSFAGHWKTVGQIVVVTAKFGKGIARRGEKNKI